MYSVPVHEKAFKYIKLWTARETLFYEPEHSILLVGIPAHDMSNTGGPLSAQLNPLLESSKDLEGQPGKETTGLALLSQLSVCTKPKTAIHSYFKPFTVQFICKQPLLSTSAN